MVAVQTLARCEVGAGAPVAVTAGFVGCVYCDGGVGWEGGGGEEVRGDEEVAGGLFWGGG